MGPDPSLHSCVVTVQRAASGCSSSFQKAGVNAREPRLSWEGAGSGREDPKSEASASARPTCWNFHHHLLLQRLMTTEVWGGWSQSPFPTHAPSALTLTMATSRSGGFSRGFGALLCSVGPSTQHPEAASQDPPERCPLPTPHTLPGGLCTDDAGRKGKSVFSSVGPGSCLCSKWQRCEVSLFHHPVPWWGLSKFP